MEFFNQTVESINSSLNFTTSSTEIYLSILTPIVVSLLMIVAVIGNSVALAIIYRSRALHEPPGILLANLAFADLLIGFCVMPSSLIYGLWPSTISSISNQTNPFQDNLCQGIGYVTSLSFGMVYCTIAYITFDRSIAVFKPFTYSTLVTSRRAIIIISTSWIILALISAIPLFGLQAYALGKYQYVGYFSSCWLDLSNFYENGIYVLGTFFALLAILLYVVINYICLLLRARKAYHQIMDSSIARRRHHRLQKSTKTVTVVIGAFLIFSIPSVYISLATALQHRYVGSPLICRLFSLWAMYTNVAINPFIFGLSHHTFKESYFRLIADIQRGYFCHHCKLIKSHRRVRIHPTMIAPRNKYSKQSFTFETTATLTTG
ncbi:Trace amine-associated receptor 5 [Trichoplax sp. H2]|nr:Trace amine-associated receptor 5 [Trichoplax sp. H2]|eukprot:RDD42382.1 Trace amine-associated receptor 5 [Trichoplax sp. H2]